MSCCGINNNDIADERCLGPNVGCQKYSMTHHPAWASVQPTFSPIPTPSRPHFLYAGRLAYWEPKPKFPFLTFLRKQSQSNEEKKKQRTWRSFSETRDPIQGSLTGVQNSPRSLPTFSKRSGLQKCGWPLHSHKTAKQFFVPTHRPSGFLLPWSAIDLMETNQ